MLPLLAFCCGAGAASADYTIVLANGRRIIVQSYREEGGMIKFQGLGGEIGISKDQIRSIQKVGEADPGGFNLSAPGPAAPSVGVLKRQAAKGTLSAEEEKAREEKEYQQKLSEITKRLKEVEARYLESVRGTAAREPNLQWSEEQRAATKADVISRFREATSNPSEPAPVRLLTPSPFSSLPPTVTEDRPVGRAPTTPDTLPPVTDQERQLTEFRHQMIQLERERDRLINEIKEKQLDLGSILLE